jgi:formylglycine-generating enzyme required for sulfatase activity
MDGRTPCYTVSGSVYRTGSYGWDGSDIINCNFSANGYRLPTNDEWVYAARGGLSSKRFPWGDTITHNQANYRSYWIDGSPYYSYDVSSSDGYNPDYNDGVMPYTSPVGSFAQNGYELCDMAGNVFEWCNTTSGSDHSVRGGDWAFDADVLRCGSVQWCNGSIYYNTGVGFRSVCR